MDLYPFQVAAADRVSERFQEYIVDPLVVRGSRIVPFYQNLVSITGSGKTLILVDVVEQIRERLSVQPIVLWLSKGKVVVWQTLTNLSAGKYAGFLKGYDVKPLLDCSSEDIESPERGLLLVATVAKFNQKDKTEGARRIFRTGLDIADQSLWEMLAQRKDRNGRKRRLIVVYDEGHNLSDQQTKLLMELEPDALIAASATIRVPEELGPIITRYKNDLSWTDEDFSTSINSSEVVASGLIKSHVSIGGYLTPMEIAVSDMLEEMNRADSAAKSLGLPFRPKAIYVTTTNTVFGTSIKEDPAKPFEERMARPIVLWRYLVSSGIDPAEIAVYCDLKFDSNCPPPSDFNLFAGGDADYDRFTAGNYRHIIFNLGLQEGWDDPECGFAYIDKDMGSADQVTQVVGRVLRQPGGQHYPEPSLNTAHFYIRTDEKGVFQEIVDAVGRKLISELPDVSLTIRKTSKAGSRPVREPRKRRTVPAVSVNAAAALAPIRQVVEEVMDFHGDSLNTIGKGGRIKVLQTVGSGATAAEEWVEYEHSNKVTARWIFLREMQRLHHKAAQLCDSEQRKFDALVEFNSRAAEHLREQAGRVVGAYLTHSVIVQNSLEEPYTVGSIPVDEADLTLCKNSIHEGYSGLNGFEKDFARALDGTQKVWCRNPAQGGFVIPLLDYGNTKTFRPDFLVWAEKKHIFAIDTKADHLIEEAAARKLFEIEKIGKGPSLVVRLVTEGQWEVVSEKPVRKGPKGYTIWSVKNGKLHALRCNGVMETAKECLRA